MGTSRIRINPRTLLAGLALAGAFLVMASIFTPERLQAGGRSAPALPVDAYSAETLDGVIVLGELECDGCVVEILGTRHGTFYSVYDERGLRLGELLTAGQVAEQFPWITISDACADVHFE